MTEGTAHNGGVMDPTNSRPDSARNASVAPGDPPHVMHVITGLGLGGAETMLANLATCLHQRGIKQTVVSLISGGPLETRLTDRGIRVEGLGMTPGRPSLRAIRRLSRLMRRHKPDIVQSWMYHADLAAWGARALLSGRTRPGLIWGIRCSDMDLDKYGRQLRWVIGACARLSARPDMIIANSQAGADVHRSLGYRNRRLVVVPNGIDSDRFRPDAELRQAIRAELGLSDDATVVALVARVDAMKDHPTFLAAMAQNPNLYAILIGRGTDALSLPGNVTALGARSDVADLLPAFDIIALSSAFGEGFPNALAEGMAAGLVPVATDVGDSRQIVADTGHIVPPGDVDSLTNALRQAATDARNGMGMSARQRIIDNFDLDQAATAFLEHYESVLAA